MPSPSFGAYDNSLAAVAAITAADAWAVGNYATGTLNENQTLTEHWDGQSWQIVPSPNAAAGNTLNGVGGAAPDDVWAVGGTLGLAGRALVEHWDGLQWTIMPSPDPGSAATLNAVAARAWADAWAVGVVTTGTLQLTLTEHWDGYQWNRVSSANPSPESNGFNGVAMVGADDVWAVGATAGGPNHVAQTLVEHWDGLQWSPVPSPNVGNGPNVLFAASALSATDVWAAGIYDSGAGQYQTLIEHWDGTQWGLVPSPNRSGGANWLRGIAAGAVGNVWAAGYYYDENQLQRTLTLHWDGQQWSIMPSPSSGDSSLLLAVTADRVGNAWAVGAYDVFPAAQTLVLQNTGPCVTLTPTPSPPARPSATSPAPSTTALAAVTPSVLPSPSVSLSPTRTPSATVTVPAVGTPSPTGTMTPRPASATPTSTLTPECAPWDQVVSPNVNSENHLLQAVGVVSTTDVWAVGYYGDYDTGFGFDRTLIEHWDGRQWAIVASPNASDTGYNHLFGVAALAPDDVWAVGVFSASPFSPAQTLILHWDGGQWLVVPSPNPGATISALHSLSGQANNLWAVGWFANGTPLLTAQTLVLHWNGSTWTQVSSPNGSASGNFLYGVTAIAASDVWAVGKSGVPNTSTFQTLTEHWDGGRWTVVPSPTGEGADNALNGVAGVAADDVWAVGAIGSPGIAEHWDGSQWRIVNGPTGGVLQGVTAIAANDVWAVGTSSNNGVTTTWTQHWDGAGWSAVASPSPGSVNNQLDGVAAASAEDIWAVGGYSNQAGNLNQTLVEHHAGPRCCAITFTDVRPADYFYTPVRYLACHGVISGYGDRTFRPYNNTTRSQMVKIVVLGFGIPLVSPTPGSYTFTDVQPGFPFFSYIETAAAHAIVSGYTCGGPGEPCDPQQRAYFRPYANVTRGQLSKIDVTAADWTLLNPMTPSFADVLPNTAFYEFVETAVCHGIISGYGCGGPGEPCDPQNRPYFRQYNQATRGQIAKIVYLSLTNPPGTCSSRPGR